MGLISTETLNIVNWLQWQKTGKMTVIAIHGFALICSQNLLNTQSGKVRAATRSLQRAGDDLIPHRSHSRRSPILPGPNEQMSSRSN